MPDKKVNRSYWLEFIGYSLAILAGIWWGLYGINSGTKEAPKSQEQRPKAFGTKSPSVIDSQY